MQYNSTATNILKAALSLFAEEGYTAVSTKQIAKQAQVNEVTLFRHFGSKEKLFEATVSHFLFRPTFSQLIDKNYDSLSEVLYDVGNALHIFFQNNINLIQMELKNPDKMMRENNISKFPKQIRDFLAGHFQAFQKSSPESAQLEAICFMASLYGICFNLYVLKTIMEEVSFASCLESIIRKYKQ